MLMMQRVLPALQVHCWGGLGSQLFAWALLEDLKVKFPRRRIRLILHQSGVTKRTEEIADLFPEESSIRADYIPVNNKKHVRESVIGYSLTSSIKIRLTSWLYKLKILSNCDTDTSLKSVKFWTIQIRGHYSYRGIGSSTVLAMNARAKRFSKNLVTDLQAISEGVAVQYRLGDLLTLGTKGPIQPARIVSAMRMIRINDEVNRVVLFSDSPDEALKRIGDFPAEFVRYELSAWDTLSELQTFRYFVSTNSKISIWAIIIRTLCFPKLANFAPKEFQEQFSCNLAFVNRAEAITYY